jgi:hypothetical protein
VGEMLSEKLIGKNLMYKKLMGKKTLKLRGRHMITPKRINAYDYPYNFYPHAQKILPDVLSAQTEEYLPLVCFEHLCRVEHF